MYLLRSLLFTTHQNSLLVLLCKKAFPNIIFFCNKNKYTQKGLDRVSSGISKKAVVNSKFQLIDQNSFKRFFSQLSTLTLCDFINAHSSPRSTQTSYDFIAVYSITLVEGYTTLLKFISDSRYYVSANSKKNRANM